MSLSGIIHHSQDKSSLTTVSETNFGTQLQLTLLFLYAGIVKKCFLLEGVGVGAYSRVGAY